MISTNDVRPGMALDLDDGIFTIVEYQHVKPGKGKAFVRMKLKNVETGQVLDRTFRADEDVPRPSSSGPTTSICTPTTSATTS